MILKININQTKHKLCEKEFTKIVFLSETDVVDWRPIGDQTFQIGDQHTCEDPSWTDHAYGVQSEFKHIYLYILILIHIHKKC